MTRTRFLLLFLLLIYWAVALTGLTVVPAVHQDEPWQASTGWKLAQAGVFGSDLFAGFHGMEQHYYGYMPLHPFLLSLFYRAGGLGIFQSRLETVTLGLLTLALTYHLGCRLFGRRVGLLAVVFLLVLRHTVMRPHQLTGILFLDIARIARYDMAVPVFGLAALAVYSVMIHHKERKEHKERRKSLRSLCSLRLNLRSGVQLPCFYLWLAGFLAALATLSHVYGLFWLVSLAILVLWDGLEQTPKLTVNLLKRLGWLGLGFVGPMLFYAVYVLSGVSDWRAQTQGYAPRFELFNLSWYGQNLIREWERYHPGLDTWFRPGVAVTLVLLPLAMIWLGRRAGRGNAAARLIVVPSSVFPVLFALLIHLKLSNYLVTIMPVWMLAAAWGAWQIVERWELMGTRRNSGNLHRVRFWVVTGLGVLVLAEGMGRWVVLSHAAATNTPYRQFAAALHAPIPPGSRVLGLHNYWLGLEDTQYLSWFVPLALAGSPTDPYVQSVSTSLDTFQPDFILIDRYLREYWHSQPPLDAHTENIWRWLSRNGYVVTATIDDPTYGRIEIYGRRSSGGETGN